MERNNNNDSLKQIRAREKQKLDDELRERCKQMADDRFGAEEMKKLSNQHKGLWFLPVCHNETGEIEKLAIMKPITRQVLDYASTKITSDGLYSFLEACMRECWVCGDEDILADDEYFIPASNSFNKIIEGKTASLLKRY